MSTLDPLVQSLAYSPPPIAEQPPSDVEVSTDISSNHTREPAKGRAHAIPICNPCAWACPDDTGGEYWSGVAAPEDPDPELEPELCEDPGNGRR
ncbi:hypothetical protein VC83_07853 [Pseudogymnoascus destructans]|uniref:Uncharacterized protein n=1 Tax=Pseudogymnoascus destructans TaxID=655981 RepID=A0A177A0Y8_9PEZI|nr:uncharacterized protein VC83_07853 [Pseudogymnoascus destructans]OAF55818.1 hypothetical protein VC83_07853 [Pseudogymnoascus destructans]